MEFKTVFASLLAAFSHIFVAGPSSFRGGQCCGPFLLSPVPPVGTAGAGGVVGVPGAAGRGPGPPAVNLLFRLEIVGVVHGRGHVWVDHDVAQALAAPAPPAQALRVELEGLEPQLSVASLLTLSQSERTHEVVGNRNTFEFAAHCLLLL